MLMVKAGAPVDSFIDTLIPLLEPGDIIIDGGNSHFPDTIRRTVYVESKGLLYILSLIHIYRAKGKESGMSTSEKLLLTWLIEDPGLFGTVKDYVGAEDFTYSLHRTVAQLLFAQFESGELKPAQIINRFEDPEEQREVAALFNATLKDVETKEEKEKALKETLCRIKRNSIEYRSDHMDLTDIAGLQRIIEDKRMLERMEKLHISWD